MEPSELKGSSFPADFSNDIPEYSDEELAAEMEKARQELGAKHPQSPSPSNPPPSSTTLPRK
jgi:hypothetical protein